MRRLLYFASVGLTVPSAFAAGYLKLAGVEGEATAAGREGWIELQEVEALLEVVENGLPRGSTAQHSPVGLVKELDKSSPLLAQAVTQGKSFPDATIVAERTSASRENYFEMRLKSVNVVSWELDEQWDAGSSREAVALEYDEADWLYRVFDEDSQVLERVQVTWNARTGEGGSASDNAPVFAPLSEVVVDQGDQFEVEVGISDADTNVDLLELTVTSRDPELVEVLEVSGTGAKRVVTLRASSLRSGLAAIGLRLDDGDFQTERAFSVLVGEEATPFEAFLAAYFTPEELEIGDVASPIGDPDGDGLPTILEFFLGTAPNAFTPGEDAISYSVALTADGLVGTLRFWRRIDASVTGAPAHSTDLQEWIRLAPGGGGDPLYEESST